MNFRYVFSYVRYSYSSSIEAYSFIHKGKLSSLNSIYIKTLYYVFYLSFENSEKGSYIKLSAVITELVVDVNPCKKKGFLNYFHSSNSFIDTQVPL